MGCRIKMLPWSSESGIKANASYVKSLKKYANEHGEPCDVFGGYNGTLV